MIKIAEQNIEKLNKIVVDILVENINDLLKRKNYVILGIPGGRSVLGVFKILNDGERIDWKKIHVFMTDERIVTLLSKESNFRLAKDAFLDNLIKKKFLPKGNVHPFIIKNKIDFGLADYENEIIKFGGFYDILILGVGEDGHVASLFPGNKSIRDNSDHYLLVEDSPKPPKKRITISRKMILRAKIVILMFIGKNKKQAYKKFLDNKIDFYSCPAKFAKNSEKLYVITNLI